MMFSVLSKTQAKLVLISAIIIAFGLFVGGAAVGVGLYLASKSTAGVERLSGDINYLDMEELVNLSSSQSPPVLENKDEVNLLFLKEEIGSQIVLSVSVPEGQSACIWTETSPDYATGANIFATESISPGGNRQIYDNRFEGTIRAECRDKYGGEYVVAPVNL